MREWLVSDGNRYTLSMAVDETDAVNLAMTNPKLDQSREWYVWLATEKEIDKAVILDSK